MRENLDRADPAEPLMHILRDAILDFNTFPAEEEQFHRERMELLLGVPSLVAHSTLRFSSWRRVIAEYVAKRLNRSPYDLEPITIAWSCQGMCIGTYEKWLSNGDSDLLDLLYTAFARVETIFGIE